MALVILLLLIVVGAVEALRLRAAARELAAGEQTLKDSAAALGTNPANWTPARVATAAALQKEGQASMAEGADTVQHDPLLGFARHLPLLGDQASAVIDLAAGGRAGALALGDQVEVARAYIAARTETSPAGQRLIDLINATTTPLDHAQAVLRAPLAALRKDQAHALLPPLATRVGEVANTLGPRYDQAAAVAAVGHYLPDALGGSAPKTYLLLLPNPAELRPAGGFAGVAGSITFAAGTPGALDLADTDQLDRKVHGSFPPPVGIASYMTFFYGRLNLGDNLDPHFPRQAATSEAMYESATGKHVDGTIAIDPYAISALLGVTGPVEVPGYGRFDSNNFFPRLDQIVNVEHGPGSGKQALVPISHAMIERFLAQPLSAYPRLVAILQDQARQRHLMFALHDRSAARAAAAARFDGAVLKTDDDYLLVTDANIGGTKGDYFLRRSMTLRAEIAAGAVSKHQLLMSYDMPRAVDSVDRALNPGAGSYHDYVQIYLPVEATVRGLTYSLDGQNPVSVLESIGTDLDKRVVNAYFVLPRGHRAQLKLDYEVPLRGNGSDQLHLQKQAGVAAYPVNLEISYPGNVLRRSLRFDRDQVMDFAW